MKRKKPTALAFTPETVPDDLKSRPWWVAWRYQWDAEKWGKVPVCCMTGKEAKVNDPSTWTSFDDAVAFARGHQLAGIGIVLNDGLFGIDLDKCRDPGTGTLQKSALDVVKKINSYSEVSPSGTGVKIFTWATPPGSRCRTGSVEMYHVGRFFAVTGAQLGGTPTAVEARQDEVNELSDSLFGEPPTTTEAHPHQELTDKDIVARATRERDTKLGRLWAGLWEQYGYSSRSEADMALCRLLARMAGRSKDRVDRLFRISGLMRDKWDKVHYGDGKTYGQETIEEVLRTPDRYYQKQTPEGGRLPRGTSLTRNTQDNPDLKHMADTEKCPRTDALPNNDGEILQGVQMAVEFAKTHGQLPDWEASFRLARKLRRLANSHAEQFQRAVFSFCEQTNRDDVKFWLDFLVAWEKVKTAEGEGPVEWALAMAKKEPYTPTQFLKSPLVDVIASMAWHLSRMRNGQPFWMSCTRLADLLNVHKTTISTAMTLLKQRKIILCVNEDYRFARKDGLKPTCKEYVFTGPAPAPPPFGREIDDTLPCLLPARNEQGEPQVLPQP